MNLITTCPSCLSQYSVSTETLRIADGWVGCGQCGYVYDATKTLKNVPVLQQASLGSVAPVAAARAATPPEHAAATAALPQAAEQASQHTEDAFFDPIGVPQTLTDPPMQQHIPAPSPPSPVTVADEAPPAQAEVVLAQTPPELVELPETHQTHATEQQAHPLPEQEPLAPATPLDEPLLQLDVSSERPLGAVIKGDEQLQTIRHGFDDAAAQQDAPAVRVDPWQDKDLDVVRRKGKQASSVVEKKRDLTLVHSILLSFLLVAMMFQVMLYYRDFLSSTVPVLRPPLQQACVLLNCKVHSWRNIDAVVIQHASLTQNDAGYYKMSLAVKNTAAQKVAMPSVELSLLDTNGAIMLRRVLSPEDLRAPEILQTEKVWEGEWMIQIAVPLPLSNYKIQVLYP